MSDAGIGFRRSLESTHAKRFGDRWGDGAALEAALIQKVSRFRDPGRGQGFRQIKPFLDKWEGKISIRSGTARLAIVPVWDEDVPLSEHLPFFPGAQVQITIPAPDTDSMEDMGFRFFPALAPTRSVRCACCWIFPPPERRFLHGCRPIHFGRRCVL